MSETDEVIADPQPGETPSGRRALKEALTEILSEIPAFKAWSGGAGTSATPDATSVGSVASGPSESLNK